MDITKAYATENECYITATPLTPVGIVVHSTGANNPYLKRYVDAPAEVGVNIYGNHWNRFRPDGRQVCVHAFIGLDDKDNIKIVQILPYTSAAWGIGAGSKGSYNYDPQGHIQFEICEDDLTDKSYFDSVFAVAAEYCAYLCKLFNLPVSSIVGHNEGAALGYGENHADPSHWLARFGKTMSEFRKAVADIIEPPKPSVLYRVQVGAFAVKSNADNMLATLKQAGFNGYITETDIMYAEPTKPIVVNVIEPVTVKPVPPAIKVGSKVKIKRGAKTYDGGLMSASVFDRIYDVIQINGDRVVVGIGEMVTAAVKMDDLILV